MVKEIRIAIIGGGGVGKSAITMQYIQNHFVEYYDPTIEDSYRKQITLDQNHYFLEIIDTAGQEEYSALLDQYLHSGDGFILVYDITNEESFEKVKELKERLDMIFENRNAKIVLCGNKFDMDLRRAISKTTGEALAKQWNAQHFESSAKLRINIDVLFHTLIREIEKQKEKESSKKFRKTSSFSKSKGSSYCSLL
jgi:GTPase KRas protein